MTGPTTRVLQAAEPTAVEQESLGAPIYQTSTFAFDDVGAFADVAKRKIDGGYLYSRWANPTVDRLGRMVSTLEGAEVTACFGSGMAAIHAALMTLVGTGDHVVASAHLYGGTHGLLGWMQRRLGVQVTAVDVTDLDAVAAACSPQTRLVYAETIGNPTLPVADIAGLARIARERDARLVVDSTLTPPDVFRPLEHGAHLSLHSATKHLGGHHDLTMGVVSGTRAEVDPIRKLALDLGGIASPFEAWLCARGIETLTLRTGVAFGNALGLARALDERGIAVIYPGLPSHPQHDLARAQFGDHFGAMLAFDAGSFDAGTAFLERVRVAKRAASLGGTRTLVVHPASITHTQLSPDERRAAGITEGMIRVAVGIEDLEDLIADFEQALS